MNCGFDRDLIIDWSFHIDSQHTFWHKLIDVFVTEAKTRFFENFRMCSITSLQWPLNGRRNVQLWDNAQFLVSIFSINRGFECRKNSRKRMVCEHSIVAQNVVFLLENAIPVLISRRQSPHTSNPQLAFKGGDKVSFLNIFIFIYPWTADHFSRRNSISKCCDTIQSAQLTSLMKQMILKDWTNDLWLLRSCSITVFLHENDMSFLMSLRQSSHTSYHDSVLANCRVSNWAVLPSAE